MAAAKASCVLKGIRGRVSSSAARAAASEATRTLLTHPCIIMKHTTHVQARDAVANNVQEAQQAGRPQPLLM